MIMLIQKFTFYEEAQDIRQVSQESEIIKIKRDMAIYWTPQHILLRKRIFFLRMPRHDLVASFKEERD